MSKEFVVIGGGISGLYVAYRIIQRYPKSKITVIEADTELGGRIRSHREEGFMIEKGAARFSETHKRLIRLLKELDLTSQMVVLPTNREFVYQGKKTSYPLHSKLQYVIQKVQNKYDLSKVTFFQLCVDHLPGGYEEACQLVACFGFDCEMMELNAKACITMFRGDLLSKNKYYVLSCGLSEMIHRLEKFLRDNGVIYKMGCRVTDIQTNKVTYVDSKDTSHTLHSPKIVCTLPYNALTKLSLFRDEPWVHTISPVPLHRIYVKYDKPWFKGSPKVTTDNPLRYIIPMSEEDSVIMYYTDSYYADYWKRWSDVGETKMLEELHGELETVMSASYRKRLKASKVLKVKSCFWEGGVHILKPGHKMPDVSNPFPGIYVCGEGYSNYQDWIEGSLQSSEKVCKRLGLTKSGRSARKKRTRQRHK